MTRQNWWKFVVPLVVVAMLGMWSLRASAHCEIPCGIYNDDARITLLNEHITTIEKSMKQIEELSAECSKNQNQITRWVMNKEDHANQFQEIVTQYFMTQRIKPAPASDEAASKAYLSRLHLLHAMLLHAMKAKQTTDVAQVEHLRHLIDEFSELYFSEEDLKHIREHHK